MTETQTVDALAEAVLAELDPGELDVFPAVSDAFWAAGGRLPRQGGGAGGLDWDSMPGVAAALAPAALAVGSFALALLADALRQVGNEAAKDAYASVRERLRGEPAPLPELSGLAYAELRCKILEEAQKLLAAPHAEALATAVMERVARRADEAG
jgi:hypothetical protein